MFHIYTNYAPPYRIHLWRRICSEFPGSRVILTRHMDPYRAWDACVKEWGFPVLTAAETLRLTNHISLSPALLDWVKNGTGKGIHLLGDMSGLNALFVRYLRNKEEALIMYNDGGFPESTRRPSQVLRWQLVGRHCFGMLTPGLIGRDYAKAWGFPDDRIYNSYFSHDTDAFTAYRKSQAYQENRSRLRLRFGLKADQVMLLCVSRLLEWKRLADLAEAMKTVSSEILNQVVLVLIGDGAYVAPVESLRSISGLTFHWIRRVFYDDMPYYYGASDMLVLPSEGDIWGLAVNEALSLGKPVICTDRIGASELVHNWTNGFKVPIRNPAAIADAITVLVKNPELRFRLSSNALSIERSWNSDLAIYELRRLFTDIAAKRHPQQQ